MNDATTIAIVKSVNYDRIGPNFIRRTRMAPQRLEGSDKDNLLAPGAVVVFRTADGTLGRLQVVAYRPLHDLSFPGAAVYADSWKQEALRRPNYERYHIEIKWSLFLPDDR